MNTNPNNQNSETVEPSKIKRPGSGRTKGSFSFVVLELQQLTKKFKDPKQPIQVSRKWAESQGFDVSNTKKAGDLFEKIQGEESAIAIGASVKEL